MCYVKTIFIGTPDFAVPSLKSLIKDDFFDIVAVITQPDKPVGRKQIVTPPLVKIEAQKNNIPVLQPKSIKDIKSEIQKLKPDIIVVVAYSQIMPKNILDIPKYGCINVHGSLLPKYRGASCIQGAILNGEKESGVTIMKMDTGLDTGPVLAQKSILTKETWTAGDLYNKIAVLGAEILLKTLKGYVADEIKPVLQDNSQASYTKKLTKLEAKIDWSRDATFIARFVRAMNPWPIAYANLHSKSIKIIEVDNDIIKINKYKVGEVFLHEKNLAIQCGKDAIIVNKLQLEGKKVLTSQEFLKGNADVIGTILN